MRLLLLIGLAGFLTSCAHKPAVIDRNSSTEVRIEECRKRIDVIDGQISSLLNERTALAVDIGRLRQQAGIHPSSARGRAEAVLQRAADNSRPPLTPEAARRIYERIVEEMVAIQRLDAESQAK